MDGERRPDTPFHWPPGRLSPSVERIGEQAQDKSTTVWGHPPGTGSLQGDIGPVPVARGRMVPCFPFRESERPLAGERARRLRRQDSMKNRREFVLTLTAGLVAAPWSSPR